MFALRHFDFPYISYIPKGDHHIFFKEDIAEIINLQALRDSKAKPYQVKSGLSPLFFLVELLKGMQAHRLKHITRGEQIPDL